MKYYAYYGHRDFVLCLGYGADTIKTFFLNHDEFSNQCVLTDGGQRLEFLSRDLGYWSITFVETGLTSNIGQRLKATEPFVQDDEAFLANYSDALTDCPLPKLIDGLLASDAVASFLSVPPPQSFHVVRLNEDQRVSEVTEIGNSGLLVNGGFFAFRREMFDYVNEGEDLVYQPFKRLIKNGKLTTLQYDGFWACMDTFKDKQMLDGLYSSGEAPWMVWPNENDSTRAMPTPTAAGEMDRMTLPDSWT